MGVVAYGTKSSAYIMSYYWVITALLSLIWRYPANMDVDFFRPVRPLGKWRVAKIVFQACARRQRLGACISIIYRSGCVSDAWI
jgi:hypothetical protein